LSSSYALGIRSLSKTYRVGLRGCDATARALCGVHLQLARGEVVAVVGPASAGKTTLLRCAAGLLAPDEGTIERLRTADGLVIPARYLDDPNELARLCTTDEPWELALVDNVDLVRGDVGNAFALLDAARQVRASGGGLLLAARDASVVAHVADRVVVLERGRLQPSIAGPLPSARVAETTAHF
jgi:ABC-type glutathione transport system ATPase component